MLGRVGGMNKLGGQVLLGGLGPGMEGGKKKIAFVLQGRFLATTSEN